MPSDDYSRVVSCCKLVDGYNVIRRLPALRAAERRGLADGRAALLDWLVPRFRGTPHRLVVVFDGDGAVETTQALRCGVGSQQVFTRRGEPADAVILRRATAERAAGHLVEVITDDIAVRMASAGVGALSVSTDGLRAQLNDAPHHLRKRAQHRAYARQELGRDDDAAPPGRHARKGNPRQAPRRRRG